MNVSGILVIYVTTKLHKNITYKHTLGQSALDELFTKTTKPLKLYIASRPTLDILDWIKERHAKKHAYFIASTLENTLDIRTYVEQATASYKNWNRPDVFQIKDDTRDSVVKKLSGGTRTGDTPMYATSPIQNTVLLEADSVTGFDGHIFSCNSYSSYDPTKTFSNASITFPKISTMPTQRSSRTIPKTSKRQIEHMSIAPLCGSCVRIGP